MRNKVRFGMLQAGTAGDSGALTVISPPAGLAHDTTVLDYLRLEQRLRGTKEGCCEGDCGACTIIVISRREGRLHWQAVNSCIALLIQLDGKIILTVEHLAKIGHPDPAFGLHPMQAAMVRHHGSQCGFCTPGIVMSLAALGQNGGKADRSSLDRQLAGNLCRCTGYLPIIKAARAAWDRPDAFKLDPTFAAALDSCLDELDQGADDDVLIPAEQDFGPDGFMAAPASLSSLQTLYGQHRDALLFNGATDVGLWLTKNLNRFAKMIWLGRVAELEAWHENADQLSLGGGVRYDQALAPLARLHPDLDQLVNRIGGAQIRAVATIGGNIVNASPIGDMAPALIALGCDLHFVSAAMGARRCALEEFFIDYGKKDLQPGEILTRLTINKLEDAHYFRVHKLSKRRDQDIASVTGAFRITAKDRVITQARIAFGGMAAIPKRALQTEQALCGMRLDDQLHLDNEAAFDSALGALCNDFKPISDLRASRWYRMRAAQNLLKQSIMELSVETK
ncbi:MAG: xanthine dehydrogenase small subunit [Pseudomonadota bacterium]